MFSIKRQANGQWAICIPSDSDDEESDIVIVERPDAKATLDAFDDLLEEFREEVITKAFAGEFRNKPRRTAKVEVLKPKAQ
jgi:hypothetical protein